MRGTRHARRALTALRFLPLVLAASTMARAACDVIPLSDGPGFDSTSGTVSTPFGIPGEVVTITRATAVFAAHPGRNVVTLDFVPPDGPSTRVDRVEVLPPEPGSDCRPDLCVDDRCPCVRFRFPDTAPLRNGRPLAGPTRIRVATDGQPTATIDALRFPTTRVRHATFPSFLALPRPNAVERITARDIEMQAGWDEAGSLLVPVAFDALVGAGNTHTQFVDVRAPALADADEIVSFTTRGQRLPPLLHRQSVDSFVGTVDAPLSVLLVTHGMTRAGLRPEGGVGPAIVSRVTTVANLRKRADLVRLVEGKRFAVFETRECGRFDEGNCVDVNEDGDLDDFYLQAVDLERPFTKPIRIDQVDVRKRFRVRTRDEVPAFVYWFAASDAVVAFTVTDPLTGRVRRRGGFDLLRGKRIRSRRLARAVHLEVSDSLLVFSSPVSLRRFGMKRAVAFGLFYYDAARAGAGTVRISAGEQAPILVTHQGLAAGRRRKVPVVVGQPFDFAVADGQVAFTRPELGHVLRDPLERRIGVAGVEPILVLAANHLSEILAVIRERVLDDFPLAAARERVQRLKRSRPKLVGASEDFDGDGLTRSHVLFHFDTRTQKLTNLGLRSLGVVRMSPRWLAFPTVDVLQGSAPVALVDLRQLDGPKQLLCNGFQSYALPALSMSDDVVACLVQERTRDDVANRDLNGDGDVDDCVVQAFVADAPEPRETNLGLAVRSLLDVVVSGHTVALAVPPPGAASVGCFPLPADLARSASPQLHVANLRTFTTLDFAEPLEAATTALMRFLPCGSSDCGLELLAPGLGTRRILRDLDGDGHFEDLHLDATARRLAPADNCPTVPNPLQEDTDGDGVGDACACTIDCAG